MTAERSVHAVRLVPSRGYWITAIVISLSMIAAAYLAKVARPTVRIGLERSTTSLAQIVPMEFAGWRIDHTAESAIVNPQIQESLDRLYTDVLSRTYVDSAGRRVMLSIAYGLDQSDATQLHRPEACYPAQGFTLASREDGELNIGATGIDVRRLRTRLAARHEPVTYWIVIGDQVATRRLAMKRAELKYGMRGQIPDGLLFRVSSVGPDSSAEFELQDSFVRDLLQSTSQSGRRRLLGDP